MKNNALGWGLMGAVLILLAGVRSGSSAPFSYTGEGDFYHGGGTLDWTSDGGAVEFDLGVVTLHLGLGVNRTPGDSYFEQFVFARPFELPSPYILQKFAGGPSPLVTSFDLGVRMVRDNQGFRGSHEWEISDGLNSYSGLLEVRVDLDVWESDGTGTLHMGGRWSYFTIGDLPPLKHTAPDDGSTGSLLMTSFLATCLWFVRKSSER